MPHFLPATRPALRPAWHASFVTASAIAVLLSACTVGPDYVRPDVATPTAFKENRDWTVAAPADDVPRGQWWRMYGDPDLDALEAQVGGNQSIAQAEASYRTALALVDAARAAYFPTVSASASVTRSGNRGSSGGNSSANAAATAVDGFGGGASSVGTDRSSSVSASWEIDLWGRIRRQVESQRASADASASDLASLVLSTQATLASDYFQLRQIDTQRRLLDDTITAYQRTLDVTRNRYAGGVSARVDVAQAETQLKSTQVQAIDLGVARAQYEHAIALLVGKPASDFTIPVVPWKAFSEKRAPAVPTAGIPSQLLERRPDVAGAERRVAAANAQIGVAKAAYFPTIGLSAQGGYSGIGVSDLLSFPTRFWSLGPSLAQTVFDGGLRRSQTEQAIASYDAGVASYRQTVLAGFAEVEDQLAAVRILEREGAAQDDVLASARESLALTINQYKAGTVSYINVVTVQATALANERNAVSIFGSRMTASVNLVRALGGTWDAVPGNVPGNVPGSAPESAPP